MTLRVVGGQTDKDTIELLERLLAKARLGDLCSVMVMTDENDAGVHYYYAGRINVPGYIYAFDCWKFEQILHAKREQLEDDT
jgi:hypothetical protein